MKENLILYEAILLLRKALKVSSKRITEIPNELEFKVSKNTVNHRLYHKNTPKGTSPLIKAMFYNLAHELAVKLKKRNLVRERLG